MRKPYCSSLTVERIDRMIHEPARFLLMAHLSIADAHCLSWG
ncbi:hypothetical protein BMS3Abin02_00025 [bacterium BMS3Abin02]|nr:hypothetical protein BMS3Abin02_00025 [bacterium BMS3Abin02]